MAQISSKQTLHHSFQLTSQGVGTPSIETPSSLSSLTCDDAVLTALIQSVLIDQPYGGTPITCEGPTYVALRKGGLLKQSYWRYETDLEQMLNGVVEHAIASVNLSVTASFNDEKTGIDAIELCLTHSYRLVNPSNFDRVFANIHRGIRGMEIQYQDRFYRYSPTRMIATNLSFHKALQQVLDLEGISSRTFIRKGGIVQAFEARQVLIYMSPRLMVTTMYRGNRIVPLEKLSGEVLADMGSCMGQWLIRQVKMDGRMAYKYFPSQGEESDANNLIRQFMATLCLIRYARFTQEDSHWALAQHNLNYNLQQFYQTDGSLGYVEYNSKIKLGSIALAALAILEYADTQHNPTVETHGQARRAIPNTSPYADIFQRLCNTIDYLWQPDGSFRTFYKPDNRNDNQNFYPGEALLFWASLYQRTHDASLLERCYTSFTYYRDWHRQNRNPAFIPWHTQAYALLYKETGDRQFLDFILEMNDWLLPMQQWDEIGYPDVQGRFYYPGHREYGPPHASSTGVYLEGLVDAYQLAMQAEDKHRAQNYQIAIWRGLRSIRQLQFRDKIDLFYVSKTSPVHGGIRTTVYDNRIRVDNVQHCLMALLKLMMLPEFIQAQPDSLLGTHLGNQGVIAEGEERLNLQHFKLLDAAVDIQPLLEELEANAKYWLHNTSRQDKIKVQRETNTIYLRSAAKPFPPGITSSNDVHESHYTDLASHFPVILKWVKNVSDSLGGELGRVAVVRLASHGRVYRHIDQGDYYRVRDRYHLVLKSQKGSLLGAADEWVRMQESEVWWFNNKVPHEAYNESDDWRIHLIFDVLNSSSSVLKQSPSGCQ